MMQACYIQSVRRQIPPQVDPAPAATRTCSAMVSKLLERPKGMRRAHTHAHTGNLLACSVIAKQVYYGLQGAEQAIDHNGVGRGESIKATLIKTT